jgi:multiple sugar transport system permease protein
MFWNVVLSFQPIQMGDLASINLFDFTNLSLDNYAAGLDRQFWSGLRVTLIYTFFGTVLSILVGLWAALVTRKPFPGRNFFRAFLLFPYVAPMVSSAFIWRFMLDKHTGIINALWRGLGNEPVAWLTTRSLTFNMFGWEMTMPVALTTLIIFEGWRYFPFAFLFITARMHAIPETLYEAAKMDGAGPLQRFWHITLPQLKTAISILFLLRFIWTFYKFDDIFLLNGGTSGTTVLSILIYRWLFARRNIGIAAAIGVLLAGLLVLLAAGFQRWIASRDEDQ